VQCGM